MIERYSQWMQKMQKLIEKQGTKKDLISVVESFMCENLFLSESYAFNFKEKLWKNERSGLSLCKPVLAFLHL